MLEVCYDVNKILEILSKDRELLDKINPLDFVDSLL